MELDGLTVAGRIVDIVDGHPENFDVILLSHRAYWALSAATFLTVYEREWDEKTVITDLMGLPIIVSDGLDSDALDVLVMEKQE